MFEPVWTENVRTLGKGRIPVLSGPLQPERGLTGNPIRPLPECRASVLPTKWSTLSTRWIIGSVHSISDGHRRARAQDAEDETPTAPNTHKKEKRNELHVSPKNVVSASQIFSPLLLYTKAYIYLINIYNLYTCMHLYCLMRRRKITCHDRFSHCVCVCASEHAYIMLSQTVRTDRIVSSWDIQKFINK